MAWSSRAWSLLLCFWVGTQHLPPSEDAATGAIWNAEQPSPDTDPASTLILNSPSYATMRTRCPN
jgi:hypothetical protein